MPRGCQTPSSSDRRAPSRAWERTRRPRGGEPVGGARVLGKGVLSGGGGSPSGACVSGIYHYLEGLRKKGREGLPLSYTRVRTGNLRCLTLADCVMASQVVTERRHHRRQLQKAKTTSSLKFWYSSLGSRAPQPRAVQMAQAPKGMVTVLPIQPWAMSIQ